MTVCNDSLYILGGYGVGQSFPSDVWSLPLSVVTEADARQRPVQPQSGHSCRRPACKVSFWPAHNFYAKQSHSSWDPVRACNTAVPVGQQV